MEPKLIELHDAIVERVSWRPLRDAEIAFEHVVAHVSETESTVGVWSYRATLQAAGVRSIRWDPRGNPVCDGENVLEDGTLRDGEGREMALLDARPGAAARSIHLCWAYAAGALTIVADRIWFELGDPVSRLETWESS